MDDEITNTPTSAHASTPLVDGQTEVRSSVDLKPCPGRILRAQLAVIALLSSSHFVFHALYYLGVAYVDGLRRVFDLSNEQSIPTWFSSAMLLVASVLLAAIAFVTSGQQGRWSRHWAFLGLIFLALSLEEIVGFHEMVSPKLQHLLGAEGFLYYSWVIPAIALAVVLFCSYLGFLRALPRVYSQLLLISGAVYMAGAVGMEFVDGFVASRYGDADIRDHLLVQLFEDPIEMLGVALFIFTLMSYSVSVLGWRRIILTNVPNRQSRGRHS